MYNPALTLHLHAIQTDSSSSNSSKKKKTRRLYSRARKLYELAFEMHLDESCEDVNLLFTLAIINNLGLIYDRAGESARAETCFGNMLSTMMYLTDSNEAKNVAQWDGLFSNVMDILFFENETNITEYEIAAASA